MAKHVNIVEKNINIKFNDFNEYTHFQNYTNIQRFNVAIGLRSVNKRYRKIFRTICNYTDCELYFDQFGTECPHGCRCYHNRFKMGIIIECHNREAVMELKELPKPYRGAPSLVLTSLNLTKLPNTSIAGYSSVQMLNVTDNQIDDINISQLLENLTELDISNNSLKNLRPEVLDYLHKRNGELEISMSGNPWTCDSNEVFQKFVESFSNIIDKINFVKCNVNLAKNKEKSKISIIFSAILLVAVSEILQM